MIKKFIGRHPEVFTALLSILFAIGGVSYILAGNQLIYLVLFSGNIVLIWFFILIRADFLNENIKRKMKLGFLGLITFIVNVWVLFNPWQAVPNELTTAQWPLRIAWMVTLGATIVFFIIYSFKKK